MFTAGDIALTELRPTFGSCLNLSDHPLNDRIGQHAVADQRVTGLTQHAVADQRVTGLTQQAELHRKAEAIGITPSLTDERQIGLVEGSLADQIALAVRQRKLRVALRGCEYQATRHVSLIRAKLLVEGFPTYTELTGQLGFRLAGSGSLPDYICLFIGQGFLAATVSATLLGQSDAFTLSLTNALC